MTEAELKKEAIQYAVKYPDHYGKGYKHKDLRIAYIAGAKPREKQIAELEKENAELKHTIAELRRDKDNLNTHTKAQEKLSEYRSDQLTKAKELLKQWLQTSKANGCDNINIVTEAEQFLKDN